TLPSTPPPSPPSLHDALPILRHIHPVEVRLNLTHSHYRLLFLETLTSDSHLSTLYSLVSPLNSLIPSSPSPSRSFILSSLPSPRSEEHTSELQSRENLVCRLL